MTITSIIENTSAIGLPVEHGLSLYIKKNDGKNILFDMGQTYLFADNAPRLGLSIKDVDTAIISHGHYDHGGGLNKFLETNTKASVYIHQDAFLPHYSLRDTRLRFIGLDPNLRNNEQIVLTGNKTKIDSSMTLFAKVEGSCCNPTGNRLLFGPDKINNDNFSHEQSLIIEEEGKTVLFAGCAHCGIINILRTATEIIGHPPTHVFAGMHLVKSGLTEEEENSFIDTLANHLMQYEVCKFYTMHCTGTEQFEKLKLIMGDAISYLSCGEKVTI